jgi:hypothetical protein
MLMILLLPGFVFFAYGIVNHSWQTALVGAFMMLPLDLYLMRRPEMFLLALCHFSIAPCIAKKKEGAALVLLLAVGVLMIGMIYAVLRDVTSRALG